MNDVGRVVGIVGCAAGGLELLRPKLVDPLLASGYRVTLTVTLAAARWLDESGEAFAISSVCGFAVRSLPRLPSEASPHPAPDVIAVVPASANSVAKIALGIADSQALTQVNEGLGVVPTVIFPRVNAAHARHPAWEGHLDALRSAGAHLIYGEDVWPLHEPRSASGRELPWRAIMRTIVSVARPV